MGCSQSFEGLSATGRTPDGRKVSVSLNHVATFASWPTPQTSVSTGGGQAKRAMANPGCLEPERLRVACGLGDAHGGHSCAEGIQRRWHQGQQPEDGRIERTEPPARLTASGEMRLAALPGRKVAAG